MITDDGGETALREGERGPCGIGGAMKPPAEDRGPEWPDGGGATDSEVYKAAHISLYTHYVL